SHHSRSFAERWFRRLLFAILPFPSRLRLLAIPLALAGPIRRSPALLGLLPSKLRNMLRLAPSGPLSHTRRRTPAPTSAAGPRRERRLTVAYHDACHLAHAQGIRREPRALLASIPGLNVVAIEESDICCGSAGIFNLVQPEMAATLGRRKADHIAKTSPDVVV